MTTNASLLARRERAVPQGVSTAFPVFAARAENSEIWDEDGNRYVDFAGGIAVLNTGHRHPKVVAAVREQLDKYTHTAFQVIAYEPYIALCERLNALAPINGAAKTLLVSTGAEAVENAVKIARAATGRSGVVAFSGGFHGRTLMGMALTGKTAPYKKQFGTMPSEVYHLPFPVEEHGVTVADTLRSLDTLAHADLDLSAVAAFIIEPVQGEGGFYQAPTALLQELRRICDINGILLIADEIQTGFGRTGKMFGIEHSDVRPDLLTVAKSMGGGLPIAGVIGRADIMDAAAPGGLGGTYAGNPLACAAALAVLDVFAEESLLDRGNEIGDRIKSRLATLSTRNDTLPITSIRGLGAMIAFEVVSDRSRYSPDAVATKRLTTAALKAGLVLLSCGVHGNVIRILVPLTVSDAVLEEGLARLEEAMVAAASPSP